MADFNPSDYPLNSVGRSNLERFIGETADPLARGRALTRLANIYKQIGPAAGGENGWVASAKVADQAVQLLRPLDEPLALASALRASVVPFVTDNSPGARERLEEALKICEEVNSLSDIGWCHWALHIHGIRTNRGDLNDVHAREAISAWKESEEAESIGFALRQEAMSMKNGRPRVALFIESAQIFERGGSFQNAGQTYQMALLFGDRVLSKKRQFELVQTAINCYRKVGSSYVSNAIQQKGRIKKRFARLDERR